MKSPPSECKLCGRTFEEGEGIHVKIPDEGVDILLCLR